MPSYKTASGDAVIPQLFLHISHIRAGAVKLIAGLVQPPGQIHDGCNQLL